MKPILIISLLLGYISMANTIFAQDMRQEHASFPTDNDTATVNQSDTVPGVLLIDAMEFATVHQDSAITKLMKDKQLGIQRTQQEINGFRLQVYASNVPQTAKNEALLLQQQLTNTVNMPVYAVSEPPFWKVRLGNFRTREDANAYKEVFLQYFPNLQGSTYVVPDKIISVQ